MLPTLQRSRYYNQTTGRQIHGLTQPKGRQSMSTSDNLTQEQSITGWKLKQLVSAACTLTSRARCAASRRPSGGCGRALGADPFAMTISQV